MSFSKMRTAIFGGVAAAALVVLAGCGPDTGSPPVPTAEWNQQKYGAAPEKRTLSAVEITAEKTWVVAREKSSDSAPPRPATSPLSVSVVHYRVGGMDCGDCQHLVANELGKLSGVRSAWVSQSPPETIVEYDPSKLSDKQIEGTVAGMGLWPKLLP